MKACILFTSDNEVAEEWRGKFYSREPLDIYGQKYLIDEISTDYEPGFAGVTIKMYPVYQAKSPKTPKKQEAWDGEGLPPEKCDCEVLWSSDTGEYVTATVLAHDQGGAIVRYTSGKNKGCISEQIVGCFNFKGCQIPNFRPIKTAEQLAEEEREKAIADMMEVTSDGISCIGQDDALALYKAGYRKQ